MLDGLKRWLPKAAAAFFATAALVLVACGLATHWQWRDPMMAVAAIGSMTVAAMSVALWSGLRQHRVKRQREQAGLTLTEEETARFQIELRQALFPMMLEVTVPGTRGTRCGARAEDWLIHNETLL